MLTFITKNAPHIALISLSIFALVSLRLAWTDALTFDEVAHIPAGYSYVALGDYRLNPEHPPVLKVLAGLPLLPLYPTFDITQDWWTTPTANGEYGQWAAGRHILHEAGNDTDILTFAARLPMILIAVLFGALLFAWGRRLAGALGGLLVLLLYVLSPNIIGHSHFVTTDIGIAAAVALAFAALLQFVKTPSWKNVLIAGALLGLAQVVKFSAIILIPFFVLLIIIYPLVRTSTVMYVSRTHAIVRSLWRSLFGGIIAVIVIWLAYVPFTVSMPTEVIETLAPMRFVTDSTRDVFFKDTALNLNTHTITRPFAMYLQGLGQVFNRIDGGNRTYFFDEVSSDASPTYFPTVFLIKETIPHLVLIIIALIFGIATVLRIRHNTENISLSKRVQIFITRHITEITLFGFIMFYAYISITGNLNIGYRHLFPMIPIIYLLTGVTLARAIKRTTLHNAPCKKIGIVVMALFTFLLIETIVTYPSYTSYFNQSVGGPANGYNFVTDSNADWGQDAKRLKTFLRQHPEIGKIRVDYFGGDNISDRIGDQYIQWWDSKRPLETGWYAISVNSIQESIHRTDKGTSDSYRYLLTQRPYAQAGTSILIYFMDTEPDPDVVK